MDVYIVVETVSYDYDQGRKYTNIYGVYGTDEEAEQAKIKCESQKHGHYYAEIEKHEVFFNEKTSQHTADKVQKRNTRRRRD